MPTEDNAAPRSGEHDGRTEEDRLKAAVSATTAQADGKDEDEVEEDLRAAMLAQGLDPADTSSLASNIADAKGSGATESS